ncbi:MAG: DUF6531 domain-containing protein, partial [Psychrosphaera sp.]|nr:DUF6531 domain-containing protein [Psychrosphaera sp.]
MKIQPAQKCMACLCVGLLAIQPAIADDNVNNPNSSPRLEQHVKTLNELTERRRINTFHNNPQPLNYGLPQAFVNTTRGNLSFERRDDVVLGAYPIKMARIYDSSRTDTADFGRGWYLTLSETISKQSDGSLLYRDNNAGEQKLALGASSNFQVSLVSDNQMQITQRSGQVKTFEKTGEYYRLATIKDALGNGLELVYQNGQLQKVVGQNGRFVVITRDDNGYITKITDDNDRTVQYRYKKDLLTTMTDLGGQQWQYKYSGKDLLKRVSDPEGHKAAAFKYGPQGRVVESNIRGNKQNYQYQDGYTVVSDAKNNSTTFSYNSSGVTYSVTNAAGYTSTVELNKNQQVTQLLVNNQTEAKFTYDYTENKSNGRANTQTR